MPGGEGTCFTGDKARRSLARRGRVGTSALVPPAQVVGSAVARVTSVQACTMDVEAGVSSEFTACETRLCVVRGRPPMWDAAHGQDAWRTAPTRPTPGLAVSGSEKDLTGSNMWSEDVVLG